MQSDLDDERMKRPAKPHDWRITLIILLGAALVFVWAAQNGAYDGAANPARAPLGGINADTYNP